MKAKLLWKRIPLNVKQDTRSELSALWQFSKLFIQRKYAQLFELANQLKSNSNHEWSTSELKSQFERLVEKTQSDLFDLISLAYSSISVRDLSHLFAMSNNPERVVELTNAKGWTLDESRNFLIPKKKRTYQAHNCLFSLYLNLSISIFKYILIESMEIVDIPNQLQMQQLTNLVSFLET